MDYFSDGETGVPILIGDRIVDAFVERFVVEPPGVGPLRGTSFAVKDMFDIAGRPTGAGNPAWRATHPPAAATAVAVERLLRAGARLVGKTRTDELAYSLEGRNFHEGAPLNPAAPDRLTGGSSSGAASAAAAGDVDFALGSDTAGSIRVPAAWCGLVGMRPTHARIPVDGLTPLAPSFDTVAWLARSAALMRIVGTVLFAGGAMSTPVPAISLIWDPGVAGRAQTGEPAALSRIFEHFAAHGLAVTELSPIVPFDQAAECLRVLQAREVWNTHGQWCDSAQPSFGPGIAGRFAAARAVTDEQVHAASRQRTALTARLDAAMPPGRIWCLPTVPGPAPRRDASAEQLQLMRTQLFPLTAVASLTGRPQITLPLLRVDGAPVGLSLLGWRNGDEALLEIAEWMLPS